MKLLDARVNGNPRQVNTKHGERSVLDVVTNEGEFTIWRPAGDREVLGRKNGERVKIAVDSKGKVSLVEHCSTVPQQVQMGFATETPETTRSAEIADYINRLGKLYNHCLTTAANMPTEVELDAPQVKDIASCIFIQAIRHFDL
jgi:bifunctional DNA-binding transcriptional regulator/antitoxin component of YhaV-PrlF toxin-antitoxin module